MPLVKWDQHLCVGVPSLDGQHLQMVGLLNQLHDGMMAGKGKMVLGETLKQLISATTLHFKYEEDLLNRAGYPDGQSHRNEHAELERQIQKIRREYETVGPRAMTIPVLSFLKNWLVSHILEDDMRYRDFLVAKGVK